MRYHEIQAWRTSKVTSDLMNGIAGLNMHSGIEAEPKGYESGNPSMPRDCVLGETSNGQPEGVARSTHRTR